MKRWALAIGLVATALCAAVATGAPGGSAVALCEQAMIGHGSADWRSDSVVAGPAGVRRPPLNQMSRSAKGLVTKMPILVEGREPQRVTVSVPPSLRGRVFLYYGRPTTFAYDPGFAEVQFQLCGNKPRTVWPGGIRIKGTAPVRLNVFTEDRTEPFVLRLGKPQVYEPPTSG
ncbi:MAG TPA: hypothetical protein VFX45_01230 [Solirubrobacterales bacterium]|nr:hypothetical protein [Solirubrobacterales bacterium]